MANLMDYLDWRGDLTLEISPFNEVDALILAELSFVDFDGIVPPPELGRGLPLNEAAEAFFARHGGRKTPPPPHSAAGRARARAAARCRQSRQSSVLPESARPPR